jgi:hypothetical protein
MPVIGVRQESCSNSPTPSNTASTRPKSSPTHAPADTHPYVAAYRDDEDPNSAQQYQVVRDVRIELPRGEEGQYEGYVGLTMSLTRRVPKKDVASEMPDQGTS